MSRYLNKVLLIGNVTDNITVEDVNGEDKVCNFFIATNRTLKGKNGIKEETTEYHRIVAWNKLAENCSQFLEKGSKVYVEGRLSTYKYLDKEGAERQAQEVIMQEFIALD